MPAIPSLSLTDLNRSIALMQAALENQSLVVLTRYQKPAYAVMPVTVTHQLLRLAVRAARLREQPDVLQLGELLLIIRQLPLLTEADWLSDFLDHWPVDAGESP